MVVNDRVLVFTDSNGERVAIRQRIKPEVGDRVIVHELEDGSFVTHGVDKFKVGDRVLVFDDPVNPVMLRIGAEKPIPILYDWLDETMQGWVNTVGDGVNSWVKLVYSNVFGKTTMVAYNYAVSAPLPEAEVDSDWCYGTWTMRFFFSREYIYSYKIIARYYFIMQGSKHYFVEFDSQNYTISLYKNGTLLDSEYFDTENEKVHVLKIYRDWNGYFTVSVDDVDYLYAKDNSITTSQKQKIVIDSNSFGAYWVFDYIQFDELV